MRRGRITWLARGFHALCFLAGIVPLGVLVGMLIVVLVQGLGRLDWTFLTGSVGAGSGLASGLGPAVTGTVAVVGLTVLIALPTGVGAAIYLQEYRYRSRVAHLVELNIATLSGVPSIVYGLLGLEIFVRIMGLGYSILAGSLTLAMLLLPVVVGSSREALRAVPVGLREAGAALGAHRWQVIWRLVLPAAWPGLLTGAILAVSRAVGEAAPLLLVGGLAGLAVAGGEAGGDYTVLPVQIFAWLTQPEPVAASRAAAGLVVLLALVLCLNGVAIWLRHRVEGGSRHPEGRPTRESAR